MGLHKKSKFTEVLPPLNNLKMVSTRIVADGSFWTRSESITSTSSTESQREIDPVDLALRRTAHLKRVQKRRRMFNRNERKVRSRNSWSYGLVNECHIETIPETPDVKLFPVELY